MTPTTAGQILAQLKELLHEDSSPVVSGGSKNSQMLQKEISENGSLDEAFLQQAVDNLVLLQKFFANENPRKKSATHVFFAAVETNPSTIVHKIRERLKMFGYEVSARLARRNGITSTRTVRGLSLVGKRFNAAISYHLYPT